jgi:hypothetical protein
MMSRQDYVFFPIHLILNSLNLVTETSGLEHQKVECLLKDVQNILSMAAMRRIHVSKENLKECSERSLVHLGAA